MEKKRFYNFRLFDGLKDELQEGKSILVKQDRIEKVEDDHQREGYAGYEPVDMGGLALLPGLIDAHILFLGEIPRETDFEKGMPNAYYLENAVPGGKRLLKSNRRCPIVFFSTCRALRLLFSSTKL